MIRRFLHIRILIILLVLSPLFVPVARAGVADIISLLTTINSTIRNGIGLALNSIQQIETAERTLQQQIVWPLTVVNQAKASVAQVRAQYGALAQQVHSLATNSATLANPKQLELVLRGRQTSNFGQLGGAFVNVYQPLPQPSQASAAQRNLMDVDDALAKDSLKTAVIADQTSEQMLAVADALEQQTAAAAPGSAPILSGQAQAANLQSQALLQKILAAELRQEAAKLAHTNMLVKESSAATKGLMNSMQQVLTKQ